MLSMNGDCGLLELCFYIILYLLGFLHPHLLDQCPTDKEGNPLVLHYAYDVYSLYTSWDTLKPKRKWNFLLSVPLGFKCHYDILCIDA